MSAVHARILNQPMVCAAGAALALFAARLKAVAVRVVSDPVETPVCRFAQIADPDANELILHQRKR
jgi:predicted enzyme related to lactoylglutathione lyase